MYVGTYLSWLRPTSDARCYTSHDAEKENLFKGRDTLPLSIYHEDDMSKKTLFGGIFAHLAIADDFGGKNPSWPPSSTTSSLFPSLIKKKKKWRYDFRPDFFKLHFPFSFLLHHSKCSFIIIFLKTKEIWGFASYQTTWCLKIGWWLWK